MGVKFTAVTAAALAAGTPDEGEYVRTTDTKSFYMGDGATVGGILIGGEDFIGVTDAQLAILTASELMAATQFGGM